MTPLTLAPGVVLELLNGAATILEMFFLAALARYLWVESKARDLTGSDWLRFRIPAHMAFAWAVFIADTGALGRAAAVWIWRRFFDAGPFNVPLMTIFFVSVAIFALGTLCKIRALTEPIYGFRPWVTALAAVLVFVVVSLATK